MDLNGFQIHAHTMGDAAIAQVLDGLERSRDINQKPNNRPCFIHNYLEENLFNMSYGQIEKTKVMMTMLNGQVVYGSLGNC